jgi:hypothetical protein
MKITNQGSTRGMDHNKTWCSPVQLLFLLTAFALFVSLVHRASFAVSPDIEQRRLAWREELKRIEFGWPNEYCGLKQSLQQFDADCEISIVFDPHERYSLKYDFKRDGKQILTLPGHIQTAFVAHKNVLFFADYPTGSDGCTVSGYDLHSGKQLWSKQLHGKRPNGHSAYHNLVWMRMSVPNEAKGEPDASAIVVIGSESYCDYTEILDAQTGASLGLKIYRVGFGGPMPGPTNATENKTGNAGQAVEQPKN